MRLDRFEVFGGIAVDCGSLDSKQKQIFYKCYQKTHTLILHNFWLISNVKLISGLCVGYLSSNNWKYPFEPFMIYAINLFSFSIY